MNMDLANIKLRTFLFGAAQLMKFTAVRHPSFREHLKQKNLTAQIKVMDNSIGRYFIFKNGRVSSKSGIHPHPDICMSFSDTALGSRLLVPWRDQQEQMDAMKNFRLALDGPDELTWWFMETLSLMFQAGNKYGIDLGHGTKRYVNNSNAGPMFVDVKNGKIIRMSPIEFDDTDAPPFTIEARGKKFTPPRKCTLSPFGFSLKSTIYSPDRILYPLKRVDFDPKGERHPENRGISGYERISWDEALDLVASEIKRVKREHGPGSILSSTASHHSWGNVGYYLSAHRRFINSIGCTQVVSNPDSWEGWFWGATHHWGNSMRLGGAEIYGTVEDTLKECEMVVFWSSDPESIPGAYSGFESTIRRQWLQELGIKTVHINPHYDPTAALMGGKWFATKPDTGNAMALGIAYVWIMENLYDKEYIASRTTGFDKWKDYILGKEDGIAKTPEWQEKETGIPAKDVRALAREWGSKKTYLGAGSPGNTEGGACRCATGLEWARSMVCLMAMQGIGKPALIWAI
jgi:anaerobic selenocysteine-containing dehydrogenase